MTENFPNLFIPGAAKSGTTTLHELLDSHPKICMSSLKEPYHIINDNFNENVAFYNDQYKTYFKANPNAIYKGESSTTYMLFPNFIERVKKHIKTKPKFIFILRNPVDRLYSHYWYLKGLGSEPLNFREAVLKKKDIEPTMSQRLDEGKFSNYFQYGLYGKWLSKFYNEFDNDQIKILVFEDLKQDPQKVVNECLTFLELEQIDSLPEIESNKTAILRFPFLHKHILRVTNGKVKFMKPVYKLIPRKIKNYIKRHISEIIIKLTKTKKTYPKLSIEDREWVKNLYKEDFELLKQLTGQSFYQWKDFN